MADLQTIRKTLASCGQEHLLAFVDELEPNRRAALLGQIEAIDWKALAELIQSHVLNEPAPNVPGQIVPPDILPAEPDDEDTRRRYERASRFGREMFAQGKVAAFVVAGGQGTRLGFDGPKGCLRVTPVKGKSLFQTFAEQIKAAARRYGQPVPWYVMTSPVNDQPTREFFGQNDYFDLPPEDVVFFAQGTLPAIGLDGKVLLADKASLALSPNGHGGSLAALAESQALQDMARRGIEYISYFQVDNPLVKCLDPLFIGLHAESGAEISAKALPKRHPMEKLGNFCIVDGKAAIIEYSDLPEPLARATEPDGRLRFPAGSTAIHIFGRSFVERLTAGGRCGLPLHRARKKVACIDAAGEPVTPDEPNAVKLEMFVFDAMPLAEKTLILETSRDEYSPVKNADGDDSLATCLRDQVRLAAQWLEDAGIAAPRDADGIIACPIEISPLYALDVAELTDKAATLRQGLDLQPGKEVYLGHE